MENVRDFIFEKLHNDAIRNHADEVILSIVDRIMEILPADYNFELSSNSIESLVFLMNAVNNVGFNATREDILFVNNCFYVSIFKCAHDKFFSSFLPSGIVNENNGDVLSIKKGNTFYFNYNYLEYFIDIVIDLKMSFAEVLENKEKTCHSVAGNLKSDTTDSFKTYIILDESSLYYKIGKSKNPRKRLKTLSTGNPNMKLITIINENIETSLHRKYKSNLISGEWFSLQNQDIIDICTQNKLEYIDEVIKWMLPPQFNYDLPEFID